LQKDKMMRVILTILTLLYPGIALAHIGHIGELAGHGHWIALGALGLAAGVAAIAKGKRKDPEAEADADESDEADAEPEAA
jgi:hypothetical protein